MVPGVRSALCVLDSMDGLYSGEALVARLREADFVAIKNGDLQTIARSCECSNYRSIGRFGLQEFGYEAIIHMGVVKIPHTGPYLFIGPEGERSTWSIPQEDLENLLLAKLQARTVKRNHASTKELQAIMDDTSENDLDEWSDALEGVEPPTQTPFTGTLEELMKLYKAKTPARDTDISRNGDGVEKVSQDRNEDGGVVRRGKGIWYQTYYCGEVKYPTSWISLTSKYQHPPDNTCGPDDGMQCIACKRLQDSHEIGDMSQENCYEGFQQNFKEWIAVIVPTIPQHAQTFPIGTIKKNRLDVCNGRMNTNQGSKTIAFSALEAMQETCKDAGLQYKVQDINITINGFICMITVEHTNTGNTMEMEMAVKEESRATSTPDQYKATHTRCVFNRRYRKLYPLSSWTD
jgi:hypothetical protein